MHIEERALKNLEIDKIISLISKQCRSELGVNVALKVEPAKELNELRKRQNLFIAVKSYCEKNGELPWNKEVVSIISLLEEASETGFLSGPDLLKIKMLLILVSRLRTCFLSELDKYPEFSYFTKILRDFVHEIDALDVLDLDGRLYDNASEKLKKAREASRSLRDAIRKKGHFILNNPSTASMLQERVLTIRNGRYTVIVREDALSLFPGTVVDRSGSGNSVYMEPHSLLKLNNEYSTAFNIETQEEQRILRELTGIITKRIKAILDAENVLGTLDLFFALSEMQRLQKWQMPQLTETIMFDFKRARHPLLGEKAVPIEINCGKNYRVLVITGPNTGGKTVALKTAGICITLGWMGFPIPASEGSILGDIGELFADIGDEQSIEQSLSTFSAHITHITDILKITTAKSVVILDELGAGTDPEEGAALGIALLEWLLEQHALVLATTHHNPIKKYALTKPSIETAGVEFNTETLAPTYKILIGIPGQSNALLIAKKLGLPEQIVKRAEVAIKEKEVNMEDLIRELHRKNESLEKEKEEVKKLRLELESVKRGYEEKITDISEKRDYLLAEADKKALNIVKNAESSAKSLIKNLESIKVKSDARKEFDKKRKHLSSIQESIEKRSDKKMAKHSVAASNEKLKVGDLVSIIGTKGMATVTETKGKTAKLQVGALEIDVPLTRIMKVSEELPKRKQPDYQITISRPVGVPSSIMIRNMTKDEAIPAVEQYLDKAYRTGYDSVTIIHGRGEGVLRKVVQELCKELPYVSEHNLGGPGEGGHGVTIVRFAKNN